jgi:hypothetical protein
VNINKIGVPGKYRVPLMFFAARLVLLLSLPIEGIKSYGDFWNFTYLASLGKPYLDFWVEFPPIFPYLSRWFYLLVGGREHAYIYLGVIFFSLVQAGSVYLFLQISEAIWGERNGIHRTITYGFMIVSLFYGWAYFDSLSVFLMILGLYLLIKSKDNASGFVLGLGGLVKWFPLLVLPAAWKWMGRDKAIRIIVITLVVLGSVWGMLYAISPEMTRASFISQGAKGSWESIWALLDGNMGTGNFSSVADRTDPAMASLPSGNPAAIPPWLSLLVFAGIGFFLFWKANLKTEQQLIAFSGLTVIIFFLWSPGYSPQWVLYILPLVLLSLPPSRYILSGLLVLLVNLLEWPILLSRGFFQYLPASILLRTAIYVIIAMMFADVVFTRNKGIGEN